MGSGLSNCPFADVFHTGKVTASLYLSLLIDKVAHDYADTPHSHRMFLH